MLIEVLEPAVLRMPELSDDAFFEFCTSNEEYRIERTAEGRVVIMSGTGGETGSRNASIAGQLWLWTKQNGLGASFDSSTMFRLPNSAMRSPDAAWISKSKLSRLTPEQKKKFLPITPEFVIELTSPSDRLPQVEEKMHEWMSNGVQLGWLIDPEKRQARVFRAGSSEPQVFDNPASIEGDGPVTGFRLDLQDIWEPGF